MLLALAVAGGCGKYGKPVRSVPSASDERDARRAARIEATEEEDPAALGVETLFWDETAPPSAADIDPKERETPETPESETTGGTPDQETSEPREKLPEP